jgi:hypothetical protein
MKPMPGLACREAVVDTANVQNPLASGDFRNEAGTMSQHIKAFFDLDLDFTNWVIDVSSCRQSQVRSCL